MPHDDVLTVVSAPLVDRLVARSWDDDVDDRSRELLEEAAELLRHQADAMAAAGVPITTE
jgi:hypothetical protein